MNLADTIAVNAARRPDHPAVVAGETVLTHAEYADLVGRWAAHLGDLGVGEGDHVGLDLKDSVAHLAALYAVALVGGVVLPMDWRWTAEEKARVAAFFDATLVLAEPDDPFASSDGTWTVATVDDSFHAAVARAEPRAVCAPGGQRPVMFSLSSGTTGAPKGPLISHDQYLARFMVYFVSIGFTERTRFMLATPLYFGGSRGYSMCALYAGGTVVLFPPPFDAADLIAAARTHAATKLFLVPTQLRRVMDLPPRDDGAPLLGGLETLFSTGAALHPEERADLLARVSPSYINFYGSTDGGGAAALMPDDPPAAATSVGRPVFGVALGIADEDGRALPPGEVGRIRYRHPGTATFYYKNPEATAEAFRNGWYYPGDLGWLDGNGYLHLAGRAKDMIIRGGVNIYPAEIEHVLMTHPEVREAAVVGWPSREFGEEVAAFVVPRTPPSDQAALIGWCRERLAPYKAPRAVLFVDELPKSGVGKVLKAELAARLEPR